ncbi:hypothetical protein ON010_g10530 [Phytophthora cinnamomi]|nr:hypothetical protein ON010_g10530 [Phytophthora cinnamomi]
MPRSVAAARWVEIRQATTVRYGAKPLAVREENIRVRRSKQIFARRVRGVAAKHKAHHEHNDGGNLLDLGHGIPSLDQVESHRQQDATHGQGRGPHKVGKVGEVVLEENGEHHEDHGHAHAKNDVLESIGATVLGGLDVGLFVAVAVALAFHWRSVGLLHNVIRRAGSLDVLHAALDVRRLHRLVHTQDHALGKVEGRVQQHRKRGRDVELHGQVREHHSAPVRFEAQRRQPSARVRVDRVQDVARDLAARGREGHNGQHDEQDRDDSHREGDHTRHAVRLRVLALQVRDDDTGTVAKREVTERARHLRQADIRLRDARMATHAVHDDSHADDIGHEGAHAPRKCNTGTLFQRRHEAQRQHHRSHQDDPDRGAESSGEETIKKTAAEHQEDARDQDARSQLGARAQPASGLAHGPFTEIAEGHNGGGREQHDLGHGDRRVDVGENHEGHGDTGVHGPSTGEVAR